MGSALPKKGDVTDLGDVGRKLPLVAPGGLVYYPVFLEKPEQNPVTRPFQAVSGRLGSSSARGWFALLAESPVAALILGGEGDAHPMRHVLSAIVQNVPGVLSHISGMLASRGYNIDSLAVGETEDPQLSRMTFVVVGDDHVLQQVQKQLEKIVTVVRVDDISSQDAVERDLMLIKVKAPPGGKRSEIRELVDIFRGRIVDVGEDEVMIEISGRESKIIAFIERMRPYGICELVRTGRIAMVRSKNHSTNSSSAP